MFGGDAGSDFRDFDIILTDSFIELKDKDDFILTAKMDHTPEQFCRAKNRFTQRLHKIYSMLANKSRKRAACQR